MLRKCLPAVVLVAAVSSSIYAATFDRKPVPSPAQQEQALKLVRSVFQDFYRGDQQDEKRRLAGELFKTALTTQEDAVSVYVLLREVERVATEIEDVDRAVAAIEYLDASYAIDGDEEKMMLLGKLAGRVQSAEANAVVVAVVLSAARRLVAARDYGRAGKFVIAAQRAAAGDASAQDEIEQLRSEASSAIRLQKKIAPYRKTLQTDPADPMANYVIGRYECCYEGDWRSGLSKLALGNNAVLKELAKQSLAKSSDAGTAYSLAGRWWDVADKLKGRERTQVRSFAASLYRAALPGLTGLHKQSTDKRIGDYMAEAGHAPPPLPEGIELGPKPPPKTINLLRPDPAEEPSGAGKMKRPKGFGLSR